MVTASLLACSEKNISDCVECNQNLLTNCKFCNPIGSKSCRFCSATIANSCATCGPNFLYACPACSSTITTNCRNCASGQCKFCSEQNKENCPSCGLENPDLCPECNYEITQNCKYCGSGQCKFCSLNSPENCQPCGAGCLSCTNQWFSCSACDFTKGLKPSDQNCVDIGIDNCAAYSQLYSCIRCNSGFYLEDKKCKPVTRKVDKCFSYRSRTQCALCEEGYYLTIQNICLRANTQASQNCKYFKTRSTCGECKEGFRLFDGNCTAWPNDNCLIHESYSCDQCLPGLYKSEDRLNWFTSLNLVYVSDPGDRTFTFPDSKCIESGEKNCAILNERLKCAKCIQNHHFDASKICVANPDERYCEEFDADSKCSLCRSFYYPNADGKCVSALLNSRCMYFDAQFKCVRCNRGYALNANGNCFAVASPVADCAIYDPKTQKCAQCLGDKLLSSDKCVDMVKPRCVQHSQTGGCARCEAGYYLTNSGICAAVTERGRATLPDCATFIGEMSCLHCAPGFFSTFIANCLKFNTVSNCAAYDNKGDCVLCKAGRKLPDCAVVSAVANCLISNNQNDTCDVCAANHHRSADGTTCTPMPTTVATLANCDHYDANGCAVCAFPKALKGGTCVDVSPRPADCIMLDKTGACLFCNPAGFAMNATSKKCVASARKRDEPDCIAYIAGAASAAKDVCALCAAGRVPTVVDASRTSCAQPKTPVAGCKYYLREAQCQFCDAGFHLAGGRCFTRAIENCSYYGETTCQACGAGYALDAATGKCVATRAVRGCALFADATKCRVCEAPMTLYGNACIANCVSFGSSYTSFSCRKCEPGYSLLADQCVLVAENKRINNCVEYSGDPEKSLKCDFCYVEGGFLVFDSLRGRCVPYTVANCEVHSGAGVCEWCKPGFELLNGECVARSQVSNCAVFSSQKDCRYCLPGYRLADNACVLTRDCVVWSSAKTCAACANGKYPVDGECTESVEPRISNCVLYETGQTCYRCARGFVVSKDRKYCVENCLEADSATCAKCAPGYFLVGASGLCERATSRIANCYEYSSATTCSSCLTNFVLIDNTCRAVKDNLKCARLRYSGKCLVCNPGYYLEDGVCKENLVRPFCLDIVPGFPSKCAVCGPTKTQATYQGSCT